MLLAGASGNCENFCASEKFPMQPRREISFQENWCETMYASGSVNAWNFMRKIVPKREIFQLPACSPSKILFRCFQGAGRRNRWMRRENRRQTHPFTSIYSAVSSDATALLSLISLHWFLMKNDMRRLSEGFSGFLTTRMLGGTLNCLPSLLHEIKGWAYSTLTLKLPVAFSIFPDLYFDWKASH